MTAFGRTLFFLSFLSCVSITSSSADASTFSQPVSERRPTDGAREPSPSRSMAPAFSKGAAYFSEVVL